MEKFCKKCSTVLTDLNRAGKHLKCKPCRSKETIEFAKKHIEKTRKRATDWLRKSGKVKKYPCLQCGALSEKTFGIKFCSDVCRFFSYIEKTDTCWIWKKGKNRRGYGKMCFKGNPNDTAHRVSYKLFVGEIEEGLSVCHSCDNPSCVNPKHLWLGTPKDNKIDQLSKDRGGVKLNAEKVVEIRRLYDNGIMGSLAIARLFNVTCGTISNIAKRRVWRHIFRKNKENNGL